MDRKLLAAIFFGRVNLQRAPRAPDLVQGAHKRIPTPITMFERHDARRRIPVLGSELNGDDGIAGLDDRPVDHIHPVNPVSGVIVERISGVVAEDLLSGNPRSCPRRCICVFVCGRAQDRGAMFLRRVDHLTGLDQRICKWTIDQVGESRFQIGLVDDVVPGVVEIAARDNPIHFAQHVVKIPHCFAAVNLRELRGLFRFDLPAVGNAHAAETDLFLFRPRIHQGRPQREQVRIVVNIQAPDAEQFSARTLLCRCRQGRGQRHRSALQEAASTGWIVLHVRAPTTWNACI
jgi:hypothetical protein